MWVHSSSLLVAKSLGMVLSCPIFTQFDVIFSPASSKSLIHSSMTVLSLPRPTPDPFTSIP